MSRESLITILGFVIVVTPFLGIPGNWKQWILLIAGLLIVIIGYQLRRASFFRSIETPHGEHQSDAFVENGQVKHSDAANVEQKI